MKIEKGVWKRTFAFFPLRLVERVEYIAEDGSRSYEYQLRRIVFRPVWVTLIGGGGSAPQLQYKTDREYKRDWEYTVFSFISGMEMPAFREFCKLHGISHKTHSFKEAGEALKEITLNPVPTEN